MRLTRHELTGRLDVIRTRVTNLNGVPKAVNELCDLVLELFDRLNAPSDYPLPLLQTGTIKLAGRVIDQYKQEAQQPLRDDDPVHDAPPVPNPKTSPRRDAGPQSIQESESRG